MTVTTTNARVGYATNGVLTIFPITFQFRDATDFDVYFVSSLGVITVPALNVDYTVVIDIGFTGEVTFIVAPANGGRIVIVRSKPFVQSTSSVGIEEFTAAQVETMEDIAMMLLQELADQVARTPQLGVTDVDGSGAYDAKGNRIKNLGTPVLDDDAVPLLWARTNLTPTVGAASETVTGAVELATQAETDAGVDDLRVITPLKNANWSGRLRRFAATFGDGAATQYDHTHNFNTLDVQVSVHRVSDGVTVLCDVTRFSVNVVRLNFAAAPTANQLRVIIHY